MKIMKSILGLMTAVLFSLTAAVTTAQAGSVLKIVPHADLKNTDPIWTTAYTVSYTHLTLPTKA